MAVNYKDFQHQIASELSALSTPKTSAGQGNSRIVALELSEFPVLPAGAKAKLEPVSISQLKPGDYVLVNAQPSPVLRRFVSFSVQGEQTRLVVANGAQNKEVILLNRLLGRVCEVQSNGKMVDPNPAGFLQRAAFKLRHR